MALQLSQRYHQPKRRILHPDSRILNDLVRFDISSSQECSAVLREIECWMCWPIFHGEGDQIWCLSPF